MKTAYKLIEWIRTALQLKNQKLNTLSRRHCEPWLLNVQVALGHVEAEICLDADSAALGFKDGEINTQRGYGHPDLHARMEGCQNSSVRKTARSLIPADVKVGAVRISATGWEGWIIEGLKVNSLSCWRPVLIFEISIVVIAYNIRQGRTPWSHLQAESVCREQKNKKTCILYTSLLFNLQLSIMDPAVIRLH